MSSQESSIKRHDTLPAPRVRFTPAPGDTLNLLLVGTIVRCILRLRGSSTEKVRSVCEILDATSVRFWPTSSDTDTAGVYDAEFEATFAGPAAGKKWTFPTKGFLTYTVEADADDE